MDVTIIGDRGMPLGCETEGCSRVASSVWSGWDGKPIRACATHNPMANMVMPLPTNFTSHSLCHACGQPMGFGPQQVVYPGTAG